MDGDHNNKLSKIDLKDAFQRAGITVSKSKLDDFFSRMDANHDGVISFKEWRYVLLSNQAR